MPVINHTSGPIATLTVERRATVVQRSPSTEAVAVSAPGPRGPAGAAGASGAGLLSPIDFSYGDASPANVLTLGVDSEITEVSLQIAQSFNGTGAQLSFGTAADPAALFGPSEVLPSMAAVFEFSPRIEYPAGTVLVLTITPGEGGSQGIGQIIVSAVPTS